MTPQEFALSCAIERTCWALAFVAVGWPVLRAFFACMWPDCPKDDPHRPREIPREHWGVKRP